MLRYFIHTAVAVALLVPLSSQVFAQSHPAVPAFNSNPGAPYTVYLDFGGFTWNGTWGGTTMGTQPAYNGQAGANFTAGEQANIKDIWSRVSEQYSIYNVNVTTVDPAVAAGQAANDTTRQNYYDSVARLQHTVIGDTSSSTIFPGAGGISYVNVISSVAAPGRHTNWVWPNRLGGATAFHNIGTASAHEDGHAFGLYHQADYIGTTIQGSGYSTNNSSASIAPTMGVAYGAARGAWRLGPADGSSGKITQNDPLVVLTSNSGIGNFKSDGISHVVGAPTALPLTGSSINFNLAKGVIVPASSANPNPSGSNNYTLDYFTFTTTGGVNTINLIAGGQLVTAGIADADPMLDGTLRILDSGGNPLFTANTASLSETISQNLAAGTYIIEVSSAGGKTASLGPGTWDPATFYDAGSYFLTGTIISAVPEPATIALFGVVFLGAGYQGWRYRAKRRAALNQTI
ncbi:MAG TPA: PEP-CTERM sorting domain-containing protein [Gemmatales bacterium]|nr:PEP-CTERM sorting domain-containing protein [Gemmatales bacterium]